MAWEQFEIWEQRNGRWEMTSAWRDFEVASAVLKEKRSRARLVHAIYEGNQLLDADTLAQLGNLRVEGEPGRKTGTE